MMKALLQDGDKTVLLVGLTWGNLDKLREQSLDGFIEINADETGGKPFDRIMIVAGETEAHILDSMSDMIGPDTKMNIDPKLKG
jgi:hypothetical protein